MKNLRTCIVCRSNSDKKKLIRVVRTSEGNVIIDSCGKINGRGAYICFNKACIEKAQKSNALSRALKCPVGSEVYIELLEMVNEHSEA